MKIVVGHLYPGLPQHLRRPRQHRGAGAAGGLARARARRAADRAGDAVVPGEHDLLYVGGGQDREQALIAPDLAAKGAGIRAAVEGGAAVLAVCGGYQLLGRGYLDVARRRAARSRPLPARDGGRRPPDDRRRAARVRARARPARGRSRASRTTPAGRCSTRAPSRSAASSHGFGNDGESGYEGCRVGRAVGTYLHGPLLPRNPWLADWLLAWAVAHRTGEEPSFEPLDDALEAQAHEVSAARAAARGGRF